MRIQVVCSSVELLQNHNIVKLSTDRLLCDSSGKPIGISDKPTGTIDLITPLEDRGKFIPGEEYEIEIVDIRYADSGDRMPSKI